MKEQSKKMKLKEWFRYIVPFHEIIYNASFDTVDKKTTGGKWDGFVEECIGVSLCCKMGHLKELNMYSLNGNFERNKLMLCAFSPHTERGRRDKNEINRKKIQLTVHKNGFPNKPIGERYWTELLGNKFVASPEGNGIQCHRTYEALYWKAIPIVEDNVLSRKQLEGLPVLFTHDFTEIKEDYLNKVYGEMLEKEYDFSFLFMSSYLEGQQEIIKRRTELWSTHHKGSIAWRADVCNVPKCHNIFEDISFITLTNNGYKELTLNCVKSIEKVFNGNSQLQVCCLDKESQEYFGKKEYQKTSLFTNTFVPDKTKNISNGSHFQDSNWNTVTFQKFHLISEYLKTNKFVLFTDGDIVFKNSFFINYLYLTMLNKPNLDMLIQREWQGNHSMHLCSGFIMIRQNERTLKFFDEKTLKENNANNAQNDQAYLNTHKMELNYEVLNLDLFPNGRYYYQKEPSSPFIVHFNYLKGIESKKTKMKHYKMWYI